MSKAKFKELMAEEASGGPAPTDAGMSRFFSEIGAELKHQAAAGSHELAAALFRGDAFVMYGKDGQINETQANAGHGLPQGAQGAQADRQEQDRGMEM